MTAAVLGLLCLTDSAAAQGFHNASIRGEVVIEGGSADGLQVELYNPQRMGSTQRFFLDPSGNFEFHRLEPGTYQLRVTTLHGHLIKQEFVHVPSPNVVIRIDNQQQQARPHGGAVSLQRLQHQVPKEAQKEYQKAEKAWKKKKVDESITHLENAIAIDPEYMEAHHNLGVRYMAKQKFEEALQCFETAIKLDPSSALATTNAAVALFSLGRHAEAERSARRAVDLDPTYPNARYILAVSLLAQQKDVEEAEANLNRITDTHPRANLLLAEIHARRGEKAMARNCLKAFLAAERTGDDRKRAEAWLARLKD